MFSSSSRRIAGILLPVEKLEYYSFVEIAADILLL